MSEVDWSKPIEAAYGGKWLPARDLGELSGRSGRALTILLQQHEEILALTPLREIRNAPRKAREWWIRVGKCGDTVLFESELAARDWPLAPFSEVVHVREILDEQEEGKG